MAISGAGALLVSFAKGVLIEIFFPSQSPLAVGAFHRRKKGLAVVSCTNDLLGGGKKDVSENNLGE